MLLDGKLDLFGGITVKPCEVAGVSDAHAAAEALETSLKDWEEKGVQGVWFEVENSASFWIPVLISAGFDFHHAQPGYAMLTKWLPKTKNTLPRYAFTTIGVGGLVVSSDGRILLMKEKRGHYLGWKLPGGASDPNESIYETAEREVLEETGIRAKATHVLTFTHGRRGWKDNMDIYFICVMKPADESEMEPKPCPRETAECRWMDREEVDRSNWGCGFPIQKVMQRYDVLKAAGDGKGCRAMGVEFGRRSYQVYEVDI
ncbi:hypothetical protein L596_027936 [Steinernema carpocapsae]|uniref:Nudix hydrolase domain-containing protein n=1 Tax=Steinernema carpocapsae TaxID=34508 RepID=A0A4U5LX11_STECR|nr:hypothetical protein L596_027936 [Steinernema carpocapsae]